jgi:anti-anti-sigma regulatory factor
MLRVTLQPGRTLTLKLEGKISGSWVQVLEECWRRTKQAAGSNRLQLDLAEVTFVDKAGRELLAGIANEGTGLIGTGSLCSLVEVESEVQKQGHGTSANQHKTHNSARRPDRDHDEPYS